MTGAAGSGAADAPTDPATAHAWHALGGAPELVGRVTYAGSPGLRGVLPTRELARASVGACSLAAAELLAQRNGRGLPAVHVDEGAVTAAFTSERHLRVEGRPIPLFAPLSGFWRAADGWVRTHANYPHHRARLLAALELPDSGDDTDMVDRLSAAVGERDAVDVQETVYAAGGLAVAVSPPGAFEQPLVTTVAVEADAPVPLRPAALPVEGVRVLDLTRVLAGPVATRTLALLGADVLRVDAPWLREDDGTHIDTGFGKRTALLALGDVADRATFEQMLDAADVVLVGYRPGALDRYDLSADALLARRPGLVVAELCAWGWDGPWVGRRGFDSLVQAGTGISVIEQADDGRPGALPAQALDHSTGYLVAAAVMRALTSRALTGAGQHVRLSLAGTATWLLGIVPLAAPAPGTEPPDRWLVETGSPYGRLRHALSPIGVEGVPSDWSRPPSRWGTDEARWGSPGPVTPGG
ncbi:CoA transferase [Cellulomonas sp. P22]|uniref:CoA transferase n=1 Tax=Cellulomonas sp. P22 TaxID=3373189 RepID=UPI0037AA367B